MVALTLEKEREMVTLKDIAEKANVSMITVSRVLNSPDKVKPDTREKVEKIISEMHYTPNLAAKNLVIKRTGVIDVYIPHYYDVTNPFLMYFITGISNSLGKNMYSFLLRHDLDADHDCDGYIATGILTSELEDFKQFARERNKPIAYLGQMDGDGIDCMDVDNTMGGKLAAECFLKNHHTTFAMLNVDEEAAFTDERYEGFVSVLKKAGIPEKDIAVVKVENSIKAGYDAISKLLSQKKFTALFCATDLLGLGAVHAINDAGYKVPEDYSVIGYDGLGHERYVIPNLTTIHQPILEVGEQLSQLLIERIENNNKEGVRKVIAPEFKGGNSVRTL